jgi:hypothetical protein
MLMADGLRPMTELDPVLDDDASRRAEVMLLEIGACDVSALADLV